MKLSWQYVTIWTVEGSDSLLPITEKVTICDSSDSNDSGDSSNSSDRNDSSSAATGFDNYGTMTKKIQRNYSNNPSFTEPYRTIKYANVDRKQGIIYFPYSNHGLKY